MRLDFDALMKAVSTPKAVERKQTTLIKEAKRKGVLEGTATQRSEQAIAIVIDALRANQPACASDLSIITKLSVTCVRDKLNELFDANRVTKEPVKDGNGRVFYFELTGKRPVNRAINKTKGIKRGKEKTPTELMVFRL